MIAAKICEISQSYQTVGLTIKKETMNEYELNPFVITQKITDDICLLTNFVDGSHILLNSGIANIITRRNACPPYQKPILIYSGVCWMVNS